MTRLTLGDRNRQSSRRDWCCLRRPVFDREKIRDWTQIRFREGLGDRRHDRAVTLTVPVITQLFQEIGSILAPDDRDEIGVGRNASLAVTGVARLGLGVDVLGARW